MIVSRWLGTRQGRQEQASRLQVTEAQTSAVAVGAEQSCVEVVLPGRPDRLDIRDKGRGEEGGEMEAPL